MEEFTHVDLFSGCGGLSLGLSQAGWKGIFAIERDPMAFLTFEHNLLDEKSPYRYEWPSWLAKTPMDIRDFIKENDTHLRDLEGKVTLIAGGPPCQGFSLAGRRQEEDPRNKMFEHYLVIVKMLMPRFLLLENVVGITHAFDAKGNERKTAYSEIIHEALSDIGYRVFKGNVCISDAGVPQKRNRFLLLAVRVDDPLANSLQGKDLVEMFKSYLPSFRSRRSLGPRTTCRMALGDLETLGREMEECPDGGARGFLQVKYDTPDKRNPYLDLMRKGMEGRAPNSLRLPRHRKETSEKFLKILARCPKGKCIPPWLRQELGMQKQQLTPLHPERPSVTITTLPDDILHYSEPRILTVRETARLQSFPDWFDFLGNYTTGNRKRTIECPRYTQVGNAVPPLFAEALGSFLMDLPKED